MVSEESEDDEEKDGLTEDEFKKTEIYMLLMKYAEEKFGPSVNWRSSSCHKSASFLVQLFWGNSENTDISLFKLLKLILFKCSCSVGKYLSIKFKQVMFSSK